MAGETNGTSAAPPVDIPKTCKAGVVVNEGPNFHVEVEDVPVPEPGKLQFFRYFFHLIYIHHCIELK
jgi:hypothetical protein